MIDKVLKTTLMVTVIVAFITATSKVFGFDADRSYDILIIMLLIDMTVKLDNLGEK